MAERIRAHDVLVIGRSTDGLFVLGTGDRSRIISWDRLGHRHVYALNEPTLSALLGDAAAGGWQITDGVTSPRRGLSAFTVGLGAWGWMGGVECRRIDSWALEPGPGTTEERVQRTQTSLEGLVTRLDDEPIRFRPTALGFVLSAYGRFGRPSEINEVHPRPLPADVAVLARRAHVGGPIVHARTSLRPYVSLDRTRAYGQTLLGEVPSGRPIEITLPTGTTGLQRWTDRAMMRQLGLADATVRVESGPLVPLLPVQRWSARLDRNRAVYPTGTFRGAFCLPELAALERAGLGEVLHFHRIVTFEKARPFAPVILYLRSIEAELPQVAFKRLEHMLYGVCSRSLRFSRFASTNRRESVAHDVLDSRMLGRLTTRIQTKDVGLSSPPILPLREVSGVLSEEASPGSFDRPDRSAHITAANRIEMWAAVLALDEKLKSQRSGARIGRIYVDSIDVEADEATLGGPPEGFRVTGGGTEMRIYRASVRTKTRADGSVEIESGGLGDDLDPVGLERVLLTTPDPEGGPLASGRYWPHEGSVDPRLQPDVTSEPIDLAPGSAEALGLRADDDEWR